MGLIGDILFSNRIGQLAARALDFHAQRSLLVSGNIANAETPGYKAVDIAPFEDELKKAYRGAAPMTTTDPRHIGGAGDALQNYQPKTEVSREAGRLDGNNVNLDSEMTKLMETSLAYQAIITARSKRGDIINHAIEQSR